MFSSPHLKVEAGTNDVIKLSKPKRENFKINNFKPGSSVYINTLHRQTHTMKVWFHIGFRVCFFMSVWQILSSDTASFTTDLQGLALDRRVRLSSSSSNMVTRQYGSLKPVQNTQKICSRACGNITDNSTGRHKKDQLGRSENEEQNYHMRTESHLEHNT